MSDGDDERDAEATDTEEESAGETDQPSVEGTESNLGSDDDTPTAKEIAAREDTGAESDEDGDEARADAESADEESASGDDTEPDDASEDEPSDDADAGDEGASEEGEASGDDSDEGDDSEDAPGESEQADEAAEDAADETDDEREDESSDEKTADEDEEADGDDGEDDTSDEADGDALEERTPEALDARLDDIESAVEGAETESDLDEVEQDLDETEADIEDADLPEPDDEEDAEDPREELESRATELREAIEGQRGPYAEDATEEIEDAQSTITETRWTEQGEGEVVTAVESFLDSVGETLDEAFATESESHDDLAAALDGVVETIEERDLDPDADSETIAALLEATEALTADLGDAEEWDDLTVREKLTAEGFYDVLEPETRKDFPPEWNAIKIYEKHNEPEPILRGLEMFGSAFMEDHCIESLKRLGSPEAYDAMEQRAQKRDKPPIEVLGKIGDDRALETLHEYIEGESDPALQKVTIKAIGEIGSAESTQPVADRLVADNETVRSNAARALGLIGDTRAIAPLADVLDGDESNSVRASAAWALNRIGTERALDTAREHENDRSFLVQSEAEKAAHAIDGGEDGDTTETTA